MIGQMIIQGTAASCRFHPQQGNTQILQNPGRSKIYRRAQRFLNTATENQHLPAMSCFGPGLAFLTLRQFPLQCPGQHGPQQPTQAHEQCKAPGMGKHPEHQTAPRSVQPWPPHPRFDHDPSQIEQTSVTHPGRTGAFTGPAAQTAVQMPLRQSGNRIPLQHLLEQVDAPPRPIQFITQQLIGGTGRIAESTVYTAAQNCLQIPVFRFVLDKFRQSSLHAVPYQDCSCPAREYSAFLRNRPPWSTSLIHPPWIENTPGIECALQIAVQYRQIFRQRLKHLATALHAPELQGMTLHPGSRGKNLTRRRCRFSQRRAPPQS